MTITGTHNAVRSPAIICGMKVLLVVARAKEGAGIWALVWTSDDDPRLLDSKHFLGEAALKVWLSEVATRYGRSNITVDWTASLRSDDRLAMAVRACVETA
jgi:hypothetical protein